VAPNTSQSTTTRFAMVCALQLASKNSSMPHANSSSAISRSRNQRAPGAHPTPLLPAPLSSLFSVAAARKVRGLLSAAWH
jgi:hypothetical protein